MKKKGLILALMLLLVSYTGKAQFSGSGSGTANDPYQIATPSQLDEMRNFLGDTQSAVHFALTGNIDLEAYITGQYPDSGWEPVGDENSPFYAHLHGNGHTITNLWIDRETGNHLGLFGYVAGGKIEGLTLSLHPEKGIKGNTYVGILCGTAQGAAISGCTTGGSIEASGYVGGLTGQILEDCLVSNNTADVAISVYMFGENIGGLIGQAGSPIENCSSAGSISLLGSEGIISNVGGLIGKSQATVKGCTSSATLTNFGNAFVGSAMGGLVGQNHAAVEDSNASGQVTAAFNAGGLVGDSYAPILNSYASGNVFAEAYAGGLVGSSAEVTDSYASGTVTINSEEAGGLIGHSYGAVLRCYAQGAVFGPKAIGGLIGGSGTTVSLCYATGDVTGTVPEVMPDGGLTDIGGLTGHGYAEISNCYATGNVYAPQNSICVGGAIGFAGAVVNNCYASGHVLTDSSLAGGLIGLSFAAINNSAANSPSIQGVSGNAPSLHRIAGGLDIDGEITNSFALASMRINGQVLATGGDGNDMEGLSKAIGALQSEDLYKNQLGWDFGSIWAIREGQGYPYFGWKEYHTNIISATVNNEAYGSISPIGDIAFEKGSDAFFTISPQEGYSIDKVLIDDEDMGSPEGYTFTGIIANHTIEVIFIEGDLGLGENEGTKELMVYPNPVNDMLTIAMPGTSEAIAELHSITGQKLISQALEASKQVDMRGVSAGVYILTVTSASARQSVKIVKE